jgi:RNA polymerase-binding protein
MKNRAIPCYRTGHPRPVRPTRSQRGQREPHHLTYRRTDGHHTRPVTETSAVVVEQWMRRCGRSAGQDPTLSSDSVTPSPFKTHFDHVRDRRSDAEGEALLAEALARRAAINRCADPRDSACGTLS